MREIETRILYTLLTFNIYKELFEDTEDVISDNTMVNRKTTDNALKNTTPKKNKKNNQRLNNINSKNTDVLLS